MTRSDTLHSYAHAYRWLAQFFLSAPSIANLESYRSREGQAALAACDAIPALREAAAMIRKSVAPEVDLEVEQDRFRRAFSAAFDVGGPRSAQPYASVYLSETGRLFQEPAREMNRILQGLQMKLPAQVNEAPDHIGVQLHVAAELCERESTGHAAPITVPAFLERHLLTWLPDFERNCARLRDPERIAVLARAACQLVKDDIAQRARHQREPKKTTFSAASVKAAGKAGI